MKKIKNQAHPKETFLYAGARALERGSFYGIKALLPLYIINNIQLSQVDTALLLDVFISGLVFSQLIGALLGDLILGNKKALFIGGLLQALGCFVICLPFTAFLYVGMAFIFIGNGLYTPNIIAQFGKLYLNKTLLLDAGFGIFYIAVHLGIFAGVMIISYFGEPTYCLGFMAGGIMMLFSSFIIFVNKDKEPVENTNYAINNTRRTLTVVFFILLIGVYWAIYDYSYNGFVYLDRKFSENPSLGSYDLLATFSPAFIVPIGVIASIIWTFSYNSQLTKITGGFILAAIALGLFIFLPDTLIPDSALLFVGSLFLLSLAEIHIAPVLYSILTANSNPKYLAFIISLSFLPSAVFKYLDVSFHSDTAQGTFPIELGAILLGFISTGLVIALFLKNKSNLQFASTLKSKANKF